jgi:hypothetical protein
MSEPLAHILDLLTRYLHIVCTTVLVGGTLFYEMVVPVAIGELKEQHQLGVFGRARWMFKGLVWISAILLIVSGVLSTKKNWRAYAGAEAGNIVSLSAAGVRTIEEPPEAFRRPGWWWAAHASSGTIAVVIALYLTSVKRPPDHPIGWMRLNLIVLMVVIFLGSATQYVRSVNADVDRGPDVRVPFVFPWPSAPPAPSTPSTPSTLPDD